MSLTLEQVQAMTRDMKAADAKLVKLVVFRDRESMNKVIRNLPGSVEARDMPQMVIAPEFVSEGYDILCVADPMVIRAIMKYLQSKAEERDIDLGRLQG